jgi:hypothetical protein
MKQKNQSGQIIIVLLLLMLVALSVGLALVQRSVTDVTTSTQVEQSSRAFSAAEAGLEKALSGSFYYTGGGTVPLSNDSSAQITQSNYLPLAGSFAGIEYPPVGRETAAEFWFVDPSVQGAPVAFYNQPTFTLFYGNEATTDKPAVEVSVIIESNGTFSNKLFYFDSDATRARANGNNFGISNCSGPQTLGTGILGNNHKFYCSQSVGPIPNPAGGSCGTASCKLILAMVRFLYINENHSLAIAPDPGGQFPSQVQIYNSIGTSGQSQKQVQAFKMRDVVPPWFDFAMFSINEIRK